MKTSEVIRESINALWVEHEKQIREILLFSAAETRKNIQRMERQYKRAVRREKREAGTN